VGIHFFLKLFSPTTLLFVPYVLIATEAVFVIIEDKEHNALIVQLVRMEDTLIVEAVESALSAKNLSK